MKTLVTLAQPSDAALAAEWMTTTKDNLFDPEVLTYSSLRILKASVNDEPAVFLPMQPVFVLESLAHRPNITPRENAYCLRKLQDQIEETARAYGIREVYWVCRDESLINFSERHGYEKMPGTLMRKKVDLK
jgi:hypothetical protein